MDAQTPDTSWMDGYFGAVSAPSPLDPEWKPAPPLQAESPTELSARPEMTFASPTAPPASVAPAPAPVAPTLPAPTALPRQEAPAPPAVNEAMIASSSPAVAAPLYAAPALAPTFAAVAPPAAAPAPAPAPVSAPSVALAPAPMVPAQAAPADSAAVAAEAAVRIGAEDTTEDAAFLSNLLLYVLDHKSSDLHLTVGARPTVRQNVHLAQLEDFPVLTPQVVQKTMYAIMSQKQREKFEEELELDFAYSLPGKARFRVNLYKQRDSVGAAFRLIPYEIKKLEDLGVPPAVANFATLPRGFVLVTGPTGSGKSTTLASVVDSRTATGATTS